MADEASRPLVGIPAAIVCHRSTVKADLANAAAWPAGILQVTYERAGEIVTARQPGR